MSISPESRKQRPIPGPLDLSLYKALNSWRQRHAAKVYGEGAARDYGPSLVLPNVILDRIVDCAHWHKLNTADDLERETDWYHASDYGSEVIDIIFSFRSSSVPPSPPRNAQQESGPSVLGVNSTVPNMVSGLFILLFNDINLLRLFNLEPVFHRPASSPPFR